MAVLKTNYVDDVLDTSLNEKRKYNMIQNADGTVSFDDVTTYTQNGDSFGAKDINDTNTAVNELNNSLTWKFLQYVHGTEHITLPSTYNEIMLRIVYNAENPSENALDLPIIPKISLNSDGSVQLRRVGAYASPTSFQSAYIYISKTETYIGSVLNCSSTNIASSCLLYVFYR